MNKATFKIALIAGEDSGDLLGADLIFRKKTKISWNKNSSLCQPFNMGMAAKKSDKN